MMLPIHAVLLHLGFVGFSLVLAAFLAFVPFYRTFTGWLLFCTKLNFWLILLLAIVLYHGWSEPDGFLVNLLRGILYPFTTVTGFALFVVILNAQTKGRKERVFETALFKTAGSEQE